jgi:glutaminyl-tRNA synthetase
VLVNYPEGKTEDLRAVNNPEDASMGTRAVPFSRELFIERDDFMEDPPKQFYRLSPGREVRLRYAYFIKCVDVVKDESGVITELRCTYDPATWGGDAPDGRKVKATLHWVSAPHAIRAEVRLYDHLLTIADPASIQDGKDLKDYLNPASITVLDSCRLEPSLAGAKADEHYQFERLGYFTPDSVDSAPGRLVFNRAVTLRDTWAKIRKGAVS